MFRGKKTMRNNYGIFDFGFLIWDCYQWTPPQESTGERSERVNEFAYDGFEVMAIEIMATKSTNSILHTYSGQAFVD